MTPEFRENTQNPAFHLVLQEKLEVTVGPVFSLAWSPDGRMLASSGFGLIKLWDAVLQQDIVTIQGDTDSTGSEAIDALLHQQTTTHQGHTHFVWGLAWSPDGTILASAGLADAGTNGFVKLWQAPGWQNMANLETGAWAFCVAWSPDGKHLAAGTGTFSDPAKPEGKAQIWDMETQQVVLELAASSFVICASWSPDGRLLATGQADGRLTFWDSESGTVRKSLAAASQRDTTTGRNDINGLAWSPDGRMLATAHQDGMVRIWNPETGAIQMTLEEHTGMLRGVAWSPDGKMLASGGVDAEIRVWRVADGQMLGSFATDSLQIWSLAWSPDGKYLAAGAGIFRAEPVAGTVLVYRVPGF